MNGSEIITFLGNNFPTIISTVQAVTGGIFTAIFLRHNTATSEFEKVKVGQFKEVADELLSNGKMTYTEYYKANNFLAVAKKADEYYSQMPHGENSNTSTSPQDFDWFIRFYEAVGNISDIEMQELWAKILAGEINSPSSFSLRTIDVLRNINKKEALLFETVCSHSISRSGTYFLPNYNDYLEHVSIHYDDIMILSELGLIYNDALLILQMQTTEDTRIVTSNNNLLMCQKRNSDTVTKFDIKQFPFTAVGREIASLKNICASNEDFIFFAQTVQKENTNIDISIHKIIKHTENQVQYETENLLNN